MKTPDEIKKGLVSCSEDSCKKCPYLEDCEMADGFSELAGDALARIQQLESDKQQLEGLLTHMNQLRDAAAGRALKMEERVQQLEAERDAAIRDMTNMAKEYGEPMCEYCGADSDAECRPCYMHNEGFRWRGVQKEDSDA